jgi:polyhydroxyalkanoate synthesis regulator phasin
MADLESIARLILRGAGSVGDAAREEARRVLDELVARGDLARDEAADLEAAVLEAVEANRRWFEERLIAPARDVLGRTAEAVGRAFADAPRSGRAGAVDPSLAARLDALEQRLARIEHLLARRRGADPD